MGIVDSWGKEVVRYRYDAWGNLLETSGDMADTLGKLNVLRYRGYCYDDETGLYYLKTRYYNPAWGRFISSDSYASTGQGMLGSNMFASCNNNPVMLSDLGGNRPVNNQIRDYGNGLVDSQMRERTATAFNKGIDCILATQIVVNGEPTVWCQQHDAVTLQPAKARAYELPSLCAMESAHLVIMLMQIPTPDERIVRAVNGAMKWYDDHMITGYRLEHFWANGKQDVRIVRDDDAGPLWARFYDLEKGEPFFCDRDGKPKRRLEDIGYERRTGYAWYNDKPKELYSMYEMWAEKNRIANRVSFIHNRQ